MDASPFSYGKTVSEDAFTNRELEIGRLVSNFKSGLNTMIISPRRWGKSSLVERAIRMLGKQKGAPKVVMLDLFTISSEEEFLENFAREVIKATSSKWEDWIQYSKQAFKQLVPRISFGLDPQSEFSLSFDWKELKLHSTEILDLPEKLCQEKNIRMVLCLDEFQNLAGVPEYESLEKKMRAIWQRQKLVSYCLYGSKQSMMSEIFNNPSKPFYRFGELMMLGKIKREKWVEFIVSGFKRTNKSISPALAEMIAQTMNDHSWYVQQLAHYTWTISKKKVGSEDVSNALSELIGANSPLYQREIEFLSSTQINLLKAIWKGESKLTSKSVMDDYRLGTPNNVSKNKESLKRNDMIYEEGRGLEFLDPAFKIWFGGAFFNYKLPQKDKGKGK